MRNRVALSVRKRLMAGLADLEPSLIRVAHKPDLLKILVVSEHFKNVGVYTRIKLLLFRVEKILSDIEDQFLMTVEPVTAEELKTRSVKWPR